ncbi:MAG: hypothetical protein J6I64_00750, partial [Lachnospiraceae bacterium]|nr:hypothetical protein [Lachnospiraceae bacterium]
PGMDYTVIWCKWPVLYDWCLQHLLAPRDSYAEDIYGNITYDEYRAVDAAPWNAQEAYRLHQGEYAKDQYLLCYENHIIEIDVDWELTEEQMAMIGTALAK